VAAFDAQEETRRRLARALKTRGRMHQFARNANARRTRRKRIFVGVVEGNNAHGLAARRGQGSYIVDCATVGAHDQDRRDIGVETQPPQYGAMQRFVGSILPAPVRRFDQQCACNRIRDARSDAVDEPQDRNDQNMVAHAHTAVGTQISHECRRQAVRQSAPHTGPMRTASHHKFLDISLMLAHTSQ